MSALATEIEAAVWAGDTDKLHELAGCRCCCHEHTFESCPARQWSGCRGMGSMTMADIESWKRHYAEKHGMTENEFYGEEKPPRRRRVTP